MLRTFKTDVGVRFLRGESYDYPSGTWHAIAKSAGKPLRKITVEGGKEMTKNKGS